MCICISARNLSVKIYSPIGYILETRENLCRGVEVADTPTCLTEAHNARKNGFTSVVTLLGDNDLSNPSAHLYMKEKESQILLI